MKNISKNKIYVNIALVLALVFVVGTFGAASAHAQYNYGGNYYGTPSYNYNYQTYNQPVQQYSPLYGSCYPAPLTIQAGQSAQWMTSVSGGNGVYNISWTGDEGLSGYGSTISKIYSYAGFKSASMTVTSGGQTISVNCSGTVNVQGNYNYVVPTTYYNPAPTYYNPPTYYSPISVSCSPNIVSANVGYSVTWLASVTGGTGSNNYTWSGSDGLTGYSQFVSTSYAYPGLKTATVTVYSNGQTITQNCSSGVNVGGYQSAYPVTTYNYNNVVASNNSTLDIGCFVDPTNASLNQPVTWNVEVSGGIAPYTYSWTGSDGLSGSGKSVIKYYSSSGSKNAIVSVTSADGKTGTRACSNAIAIRGTGSTIARAAAPVAPVVQTAPATQNNSANNGLSASALFSLSNVPWGWIAVLVILVLFGTVMYLVFNKPKI